MQIKRLHIDNFKCLQNFDIEFSTKEEGGSSSFLIGDNGTGKSSMLEAIIRIFISIYSLRYNTKRYDKKFENDFEIEYDYASKTVRIKKTKSRYDVWVNDEKILNRGSITKFRNIMRDDTNRLLPLRIISFYSGMNNKIQELYTEVYKNYHDAYFEAIKNYYWNFTSLDTAYLPTKNFIYCHEDFTQVYLCAFMCCINQNQLPFLTEKIGITGIASIKIALNTEKLERVATRSIETNDLEKVLEYLDNVLCELFTDPIIDDNVYYYEIDTKSNWSADAIQILDFFERLQSIFDAKISVDVYIDNNPKPVNCDDLSEGQRQLIKMIGMLGLCRFQDTLVLLDEPDAHMNPKWKYAIKEIIDGCLTSTINTQAIIATHDPLVINGAPKEAVRIFNRNGELNATKVIIPTEDTEGMGIDGLLQSEYYGMPSILDSETRRKLNEKYSLLVKKKEKSITEPELQRLAELTEELENMMFARNIPTDSYYDEYVAAMHKIYSERPKVSLTAEDIAERNAKAEEILRGLLGK